MTMKKKKYNARFPPVSHFEKLIEKSILLSIFVNFALFLDVDLYFSMIFYVKVNWTK